MRDFDDVIELFRSTQRNLESLAEELNRHTDRLDSISDDAVCRIDDLEIEVEEAKKQWPEEFLVVDISGKILIDGHHVGWVRRDAYPQMVSVLGRFLGVSIPNLSDMETPEETR